MKKTKFQRLTATTLALVPILAVSASADNRPRNGTDLRKVAAELAAVLGQGAVTIERGSPATGRRQHPPIASDPASSISPYAVVDSMNRFRTQHGLIPLRTERRLDLAAGEKAHDMTRKGYFAHVAPDGSHPATWASRHGYRHVMLGENLATGYRTADDVVRGWMQSPGHRANILAPEFRDVGLAVVEGSPMGGSRGPTIVALYGSESRMR